MGLTPKLFRSSSELSTSESLISTGEAPRSDTVQNEGWYGIHEQHSKSDHPFDAEQQPFSPHVRMCCDWEHMMPGTYGEKGNQREAQRCS